MGYNNEYSAYGDGTWLKYDHDAQTITQRKLVWGGSSGYYYHITVLDEENDICEEYAESISGKFLHNL